MRQPLGPRVLPRSGPRSAAHRAGAQAQLKREGTLDRAGRESPTTATPRSTARPPVHRSSRAARARTATASGSPHLRGPARALGSSPAPTRARRRARAAAPDLAVACGERRDIGMPRPAPAPFGIVTLSRSRLHPSRVQLRASAAARAGLCGRREYRPAPSPRRPADRAGEPQRHHRSRHQPQDDGADHRQRRRHEGIGGRGAAIHAAGSVSGSAELVHSSPPR